MNGNMSLQLYNGLGEDEENDNQSCDDNDTDDLDQDELEIALYSQIHFETSDTVEAPDGLHNDDVVEKFMIDVQGNDKSGFQTSLTTADYVTNEIIGAEYGTNDGKEEKTLKSQKFSLFTKAVDLDDKTAEKQVKQRDKKRNAKLIEKRKFAEHLILKAASSADSEYVDSDQSVDSANTESDSEDDLIDLDLEDSEDDSGLFVNVSRNQRPLLEPNNVNDWSIDENDVPDYTSRFNKSRYYKPINVSCHNCDKIGHLSKNCPQPKKAQTCGFCSESGHHMKICPDSICYNCEEPGHIAKECGQPKKKWFTQCTRCSMQGHRKSVNISSRNKKCPDQWRQYHKTVDGKKLIREKKKLRQRHAFCYNCAGDDHLGHECEEDRMDRYSKPSYPFICNYVPINYNYSQFERDFPSFKEVEQERKHSSKKTHKKTMSFSHSFVKKETLSNTTGRNNFDKLLFASNKTRENKYNSKTSTPSSVQRKKQPKSSHIIFNDDDSLFSSSKLESDFKFGFKSHECSDFDSQVSDKKRKVETEIVSASKKQKVSDSEKKKNKKRNFERDNTDSPKRSRMDEEDSLGTISVTFATRNINITDRPSKRRQKQDSFKKRKSDVVDKRMKSQSYIERDTFRDEINVTVSNKEKDFPRGGKKKKDSFRDEISVSFIKNLAKSGNERKSERGFIKTKKFESVVIVSDESSEEIDHQVYNNEWWLKKNGKKNKRKNRNKY